MARILISGATGFLGRHLVESLRKEHRVFALTRAAGQASDSPNVTWVRQDLCAAPAEAALPDQIDAVIHLAQSRHYREFPERADDIFGVNVHGTFRLLEYARNVGAKRFVLASSGGVYGSSFERLTETAPANPLNFYQSSKFAAELMAGSYGAHFPTIVLRFFFVYGPGQTRMLIPTLLQKVREGRTVTVEGDPGLRINPVFVADAVKVFGPVLRCDRSDVFNVAGAETVTMTDLVKACSQALGRSARIDHSAARSPGDLVGSTEKLRATLGVDCGTSLEQGLRATVASMASDDVPTVAAPGPAGGCSPSAAPNFLRGIRAAATN